MNTPSTAAGLLGLIVPGGGQLMRKQLTNAGFVALGAVVPLFWFGALITQMANRTLALPGQKPAWTLWDGQLMHHLSELKSVPPEIMALPLIALTIHLLGAWVAWKGVPTRPPAG